MTYDKESFMKGLLTGLRLGRPAAGSAWINTGLGWAANRNYLVYATGTELVRYGGGSTRTPYVKLLDGWAVCAIIKNLGPVYSTYWTGPLLISTVQDNVRYAVNGTEQTVINTFSFLELTWILNRDAWNSPVYSGGDQTPVTAYPIFDAAGYAVTASDVSQVAVAVLQAAGVRRI